MEKFMLLFVGGDAESAKLSAEEANQNMQKWYQWVQDLTKKGTYLSGEPLQKGGKILSKTNGKVTVTDGPFPEAKELVGGYFIINAKDINEAAEIAKDSPGFETGGTVVVRPVMKM